MGFKYNFNCMIIALHLQAGFHRAPLVCNALPYYGIQVPFWASKFNNGEWKLFQNRGGGVSTDKIKVPQGMFMTGCKLCV